MPKSKHEIPGRVRSSYAFIKAHRDQYSVQMMCRVLEVAVSGYYDWLKQPISNHDQEEFSRYCRLRAPATNITDRGNRDSTPRRGQHLPEVSNDLQQSVARRD